MAVAERDGDRIRIAAPLREKDLVKQLPGARYVHADDCWYSPLSWGVCQALRGVFKDRLEIGPRLQEWAWNEHQTRIQPAASLRVLERLELPPLEGVQLFRWNQLFPFQQADVAFGSITERYLNASEMGAGKTITSLANIARWQMRYSEALPILIVCTNTMKRTWQREIKTWVPWLRSVVISGTAAHRRKLILAIQSGAYDVAIINWESLRSHSRLAPYGSIHLKRCKDCGGDETVKPARCEVHPKELNEIRWRTIVVDEAHRMKSPRSLQTRAVWAVAHGSGSRFRIALTGTPIADTPDDLWPILHFIAPEDWAAKTAFTNRFCALAYNPFGGMDIVGLRSESKDEFYRVFDTRSIRRLTAQVLPQLPPIMPPQVRVIDMNPAQERAYRKLQKDMVAQVEGGTLVVTSPLVLSGRLDQLACACAEIDETSDSVTLIEPSNKVEALLEIIEERAQKPLVAMAESRQLIELCERRLTKEEIPFLSIHGNIPEPERDGIQEAFQTGKYPVLLGTLGAGSEGLTLTAADTLLFLQKSWSMLKNTQATGRVRRPGSEIHEQIHIIELVSAGTIEEWHQTQVLAGKGDRLEEIVRDRQTLMEMLEYRGSGDD